MTENRREQIVRTAREMLAEDPGTTLAVRAVAERVGIGASTLRHYFPTQRALHEAVLAASFATTASDLRIRDTQVPARERLSECLLQLLPPAHPADLSMDRWIDTINSVFGSTAKPEARTAWASYVVQTRRQISDWLRILAAEGMVAGGSEERGARFLLTVLDGMALGRILPTARLDPTEEAAVLNDALTVILRTG
ncbi:TetR/AcrR family transcriptional regulator [Streptomyces sp. NPDC049744]|uniref:TetR/AcrR family transcriptional regulator n=1 Tax=Streptomyces sp. NPDC049744 TaxID=3154359 RepID=UPI00343309B3